MSVLIAAFFIILADRNNFLSNNMSQSLQVEHYFLLKSIFHLQLNFSNHFVLQKIFPIKDDVCSVYWYYPPDRYLCLLDVLTPSGGHEKQFELFSNREFVTSDIRILKINLLIIKSKTPTLLMRLYLY